MNLILAILLLAVISYYFKLMLDKSNNLLLLSCIYIIHILSLFFNYKINLEAKLDSYNFYTMALDADSAFILLQPGSRFISFLIYPLVKLNIEYLTLSCLFATLSLIGFLKIIKLFFPLDTKLKKIGMCFMFFPSLHFWSSSLSKEALVFFFMALILEQTVKAKTLSLVTVISLLLILLIRPYLFILLLLSLCVKFLVFETVTRKKLIKNLVSFVLLGLFSIPFLKFFLKIKVYSFSEIEKIFNKINLYSVNTGNTSINFDRTNYLDRIIIVLFRPLFFDSVNFYQLLVSIENACFLLFCVLITYYGIKRKVIIDSLTLYLILSSVLIILFLSTYMYNLGLASRMRVMFLPFIVLGMVLMFSSKKTSLHEKKNN